jgi:murein DD-endopeptidase MepM/ murein hydrolase activator NlpD
MAGRHTPHTVVRARRPSKLPMVRKSLTSLGATFVAIALAASVGIPVTAASANLALTGHGRVGAQALTVAGGLSTAAVTRDGSTIGKVTGKPGPSVANVDGWAEPIGAAITSGFGPRAIICVDGGCTSPFHKGDDFAAACGTPFYAAAAGTVTSVGYEGTDGEMIEIQHAGGITTAYAHISPTGLLVAQGDRIIAGQNIGLVGSSGTSTGCHLYFEYRVDGLPVDPVTAMAAHGIALG